MTEMLEQVGRMKREGEKKRKKEKGGGGWGGGGGGVGRQ